VSHGHPARTSTTTRQRPGDCGSIARLWNTVVDTGEPDGRKRCAASPSDEIPAAGRRGSEGMTSGSTAYSRSKDQQDSSMPSKQEPSEDVDDVVLQGPRERARAALPEPQTPAREEHLPRLQRLQRGHRYTADHVSPSESSGRWAMGDQPIQRTAQVKGSNGAPTSRSDVYRCGNAGWPTGRESYGHGAPVVVGGRKGTAPPSTTGKPTTGRRGSRRKSARAHGATPMGRAGVNEDPAGRGT
jgi:hypothetical protein